MFKDRAKPQNPNDLELPYTVYTKIALYDLRQTRYPTFLYIQKLFLSESSLVKTLDILRSRLRFKDPSTNQRYPKVLKSDFCQHGKRMKTDCLSAKDVALHRFTMMVAAESWKAGGDLRRRLGRLAPCAPGVMRRPMSYG